MKVKFIPQYRTMFSNRYTNISDGTTSLIKAGKQIENFKNEFGTKNYRGFRIIEVITKTVMTI